MNRMYVVPPRLKMPIIIIENNIYYLVFHRAGLLLSSVTYLPFPCAATEPPATEPPVDTMNLLDMPSDPKKEEGEPCGVIITIPASGHYVFFRKELLECV